MASSVPAESIATLTPVAVLCLGYPAAIPEAVTPDKPPIFWVL
jgi:hypothetical protein